jgi:hypothetical protein
MSHDIASGQSEAAGAPTKNESTYLTPPKDIVDIIDITQPRFQLDAVSGS